MSGTRLARTGRCRFLVCLVVLVLIVGMVTVFHSSKVQLDETREQRLHCEQQQEALNERLTTLVEQKYHLERNHEHERSEHLENKRNLEQKIKELEEHFQKEQVEEQMRYDKLKQTHIILQSEHQHLKEETQTVNKQQLENINSLQKKLQSVRSDLQKEKFNKSGELIEWMEKYNIAASENKRLSNDKRQQEFRIKELEQNVEDYQSHCETKAMSNFGKAVGMKSNIIDRSISEKSFQHQESVSEGVYHISINFSNSKENKIPNGDGVISSSELLNTHVGVKDRLILNKNVKTTSFPIQNPSDTNNDTKPLSVKPFNGSLILNSVENFQIVPKAIKNLAGVEVQQQERPNRTVSLEIDNGLFASKAVSMSEHQVQVLPAINATSENIRTARESSTSSSNSPPLALPPNQRKLPENVAPIPENFEFFLKKSHSDNVKSSHNPLQMDKNLKHVLNNRKPVKFGLSNNNNYDSGAHEIKDVMAEVDDDNIQHDDDINNFFENGQENKAYKNKNLVGKDDDGGLAADNEDNILGGIAAGDISVKHNQQKQLLDDSLRNEVADDQGKEFGDGLRLDEGAMEEDDDDDYSNLLARKQGGQAIRN